jgi:glyoxylase-like metal-dependent hydrolase (beta-lactamase superfamily II)
VTGPAPWRGGTVGDRARCVLAPNPGPMTLEGTNTWLLAEPGADAVVVVDPGPDDPAHRRAILAAAADGGGRVVQILLTHSHPDHAEGARALAAATAAPVRALDPSGRLGDDGIGDGDSLAAAGLELQVVATPGHTADSLSFLLPADAALLTGDTVLGRGTAVVAWPDGVLADYLASLAHLASLAGQGDLRRLLPGHGPVLDDPAGVLQEYLRHRQARLRQVAEAVAAGASTPRGVVEAVYADVDPVLWSAAELSVRAQLDYLAAQRAEAGGQAE